MSVFFQFFVQRGDSPQYQSLEWAAVLTLIQSISRLTGHNPREASDVDKDAVLLAEIAAR
jgi:hypothetical protein